MEGLGGKSELVKGWIAVFKRAHVGRVVVGSAAVPAAQEDALPLEGERTGISESPTVNCLGKPDAGNSTVRFDVGVGDC